MENRVFRGGQAAVASIDVAGQASDALLAALRDDPPRAGRLRGDARRGCRAPTVSSVRPFPARVVRQDWARRHGHRDVGLARRVGRRPRWGSRSTPRRTTSRPPRSTSTASAVDDASHIGVVCEVAVQAVADGRVRGHEAVHAQRVEALVWHHATTNAPPALVTLLHRAGPAFTRTVEAACRTPPILDFAGPRGLQQTVWRVAEGPATRRRDRGAGRSRPLHRRRPPPGRGRARGVAARRQARGRRSALRHPPDGRPAAVRLPSPGDRARGRRRTCSSC